MNPIKNINLVLIIFILSNKFIISELFKDSPDNIFFKEYLETISSENSKNYKPNRKSRNNNYNDDFPEKPTSSFDFLFKSFINKINAYFYSYNDYFDGLKYVLSKYKILFKRFSSHKIINETISKSRKPKYEKYFRENKKFRNLDQKSKSKNKKINKLLDEPSYPFNNTDLYNTTECPSSPNLKVNYYLYFCNREKVSKSDYEKSISKGEKCEFYNNTQKICFCPIHYSSCKLMAQSRIRCMAKEVIVNNEINLTEYYDTFYEEFFKTPILDNKEKIFNFSLKLKCGMPINDDITGGKDNFYLSSEEDNNAEFDIISTIYDGKKNGTQYTKDDINNKTTNILNYFIKKRNLVMYMKPKMSLKFSLIDMQWALPFRYKYFDINEDLIEDLLSGKQSFNFTVDLNDLIENCLGVGPFSQKNISYPYFDKGDIHFFEFDIEEKEKQMRFYPVRGEIKK